MAALWFQMARQDHGLSSPEKCDEGCQGPERHTYSDLPLRGQKAVLLISWPAACDGDSVSGRASEQRLQKCRRTGNGLLSDGLRGRSQEVWLGICFPSLLGGQDRKKEMSKLGIGLCLS